MLMLIFRRYWLEWLIKYINIYDERNVKWDKIRCVISLSNYRLKYFYRLHSHSIKSLIRVICSEKANYILSKIAQRLKVHDHKTNKKFWSLNSCSILTFCLPSQTYIETQVRKMSKSWCLWERVKNVIWLAI